MTVARRLQGALVAFVLLVAVVAAFEVRTIRSASESSHALAEISSRLRIISTDQVARVAQMRDDAERFLVTHDPAYLERANVTGQAFGRELTRLDSLELSGAERSGLVHLAIAWRSVGPVPVGLGATTADATIRRFQGGLDRIEDATRELSAASQGAMTGELHSVERAARVAERVSLTAAGAALILMILLSAHLVRTIVGPLGRLAEGTRQVSAGHFDHRLDANGHDELAQVARDFNAMTSRLGDLDRLKREFVAQVSHDLKTPLSSMQETTSAVLDGVAGPLSDIQRQLLTLNLESSRRLSGMLSKLLDLSRLEARLEPTRQIVDVGVVVSRAAELASAWASQSGRRVIVIAPTSPSIVRGDAQALGQVIDNLLENALKFSPPGGTVTVGAEPHLGGLLFSVADEGPGIPDAEKERVFERFYQTETGRAARGRGAGLGLAICREIVTAHDGRIWVSDNEPRGSVFRIMLPSVAIEPAVGQVAA